MSLKKVFAGIKRNKHFLITTHTNPEGDALGSELALYNLLKVMGKQAVVINQDPWPPEYSFLPGIKNIKRLKRFAKRIKFDCLLVVDCSDLKRTGEVFRLNINHRPIVNIDHHISNEKFGDINWIEPHASSCAEMVYKLYQKLRIPLGRQASLPLYTAILTDTGSFRYNNTTSFTHKMAADLLRYNLGITKIYHRIYEDIPFADMQLLIKLLPYLRRSFSGKVAWFQIKQNMLKRQTKNSFDLTEHLLSFARAIKDVEAAVLFKENLGVKNEVRINLRSHGKIDVNKIARYFGGGGHKTASGATVKGKIDTVRRKVLAKIKENLP